ncbi:MAG TPA: hypothetical protein VNT57_00740 [Desulfobacteria bacterium]|nr:hypothetical protein [Desulfobacteria bacterium]
MLRRILLNTFIQAYRVLFVAAFLALNLVGIAFLGVVGYYLVF